MEEIIKILEKWVAYGKGHPDNDFEDFCRFYLAASVKRRTPAPGPGLPFDTDSMFMMTVSRTTLAFWVYMRIALKDTPLPSIESIMFCSALHNLGESRKSDVINYAMMEISTGTDILNRLIKKGLIHQRVDPNDKRAKLLSLSAAGATALKKCYKKAGMAREVFLMDTTEDDKRIVAQVLYPLQEKQARLAMESKGKTIDEIHALLQKAKK